MLELDNFSSESYKTRLDSPLRPPQFFFTQRIKYQPIQTSIMAPFLPTTTLHVQGDSNMTRTDLWVNKPQSVPVIFEPPCTLKFMVWVSFIPWICFLSLYFLIFFWFNGKIPILPYTVVSYSVYFAANFYTAQECKKKNN
jgi:hypothetical protein